MFANKTVLFVSEKLAALKVVRNRLDHAGLGDFCLELHSHKTNKRILLSEMERRLELRGNFPEPRELAVKSEAGEFAIVASDTDYSATCN